jgi:hypothetical protein
MSWADKILVGWGIVAEPGTIGFERVKNEDGSYSEGRFFVANWPTDNPPTIAEIEAIELPPDPTLRHMAPYDFQNRFTDAELVAIQTSVDPILIRGRTKLQTIITFIDLDLDETQQFIGYLAIIGVIQPSRVAEILA